LPGFQIRPLSTPFLAAGKYTYSEAENKVKKVDKD